RAEHGLPDALRLRGMTSAPPRSERPIHLHRDPRVEAPFFDMSKAKTRKPPKKVPTEKKALAAAKILVDGKSTREAAREVGVSKETARTAAKEAETNPDLGQYLAAYRAKALPKWLEVIDRGAEAALSVMPESSGRDIA